MRREHAGLAALVAVGMAAALVPSGPPPAAAAGVDWVGLLRRDVAVSVDAAALTRIAADGGRVVRTGAGEPSGTPGGVYGQDCVQRAPSRLALRRATVTVTAEAARFTAAGCERWSADDLAGGAVAWRIAAPGGDGDADYTVAVVGEDLEAVVTANDGQAVARGEAWLDEEGDLSVTVPVGAIGNLAEFGLVVAASDGAGGGDALTGREGRPLLFPSTPETAVAGAVTVTVEDGAFDRAAAGAEAAGFQVTTPVPAIGAFGVEAVDDGDVRALRGLPGVADVTPAAAAAVSETPTAAFYSRQWALADIDAPRAWRQRTGSGLTVAVVDSGVDGTRADLRGRVLAGRDTWTGQDFPANTNSDLNDHGTGVAGIIAADKGNDVAGVDWTARIRPYRFTDASGAGPVLAVASAIVRATDAGADVVNLSLGTTDNQRHLADAVRYATDRGVILVAASGNAAQHGNPTMYPAAYPSVIAVGATTPAGRVAPYSNTGPHLHLTAPGGDGGRDIDRNVIVLGRGTVIYAAAGTSFAAPHVAGAASLYLAGHPAASPAAVATALAQTARDAGPAGKDPAYGHGILDLGTLITRKPVANQAVARACPPERVARPRFSDVFSNSHYEAIACLSWWKVTGGVTPTTYAPGDRVRRGQMATFLVEVLRQAGVRLPDPTNQGFADVRGTTHERAINQLAALGIASGTSATTFSPGRPVTRDQMATFIVNTHRVATGESLAPGPGSEGLFRDIRGNRHEHAIRALASAGVVSGTGHRTYSPRAEVTRAQMASFLMREMNLLVAGGHATRP